MPALWQTEPGADAYGRVSILLQVRALRRSIETKGRRLLRILLLRNRGLSVDAGGFAGRAALQAAVKRVSLTAADSAVDRPDIIRHREA